MRLELRSVVVLLAVLGLGLVAGTVPVWLGEALFCDASEKYCGLFWLFFGYLGPVIAGGICGCLGPSWSRLAAGLVGVGIGWLIGIALREPWVPLTWELFSGWIFSGWIWAAIAAFVVGYGFGGAVIASIEVVRRRVTDHAAARSDAARDAEAEGEDA